ncbi:DUF4352 domain-containing protein [Gordonia sp. (in: high G+C Gram-positive bacteria)]|uniref:DUF4352 domain-containing protein n=1 Tax=Gordonia sp. (in: high G+C Gram-positive bacteria) TaxID=84139 RepID=UPI0035280185
MSKLRNTAVAVMACLALGATIASGSEDKATKVDGNGSTQQGDTFKVGDTVKLGDWKVKVNKVTDPYVPSNEFVTPSPGNRYVLVDTEVTNDSKKSQTVSSMMCFDLRDDSNRKHDITITGDETSSLDGEVAPGGTLRGDLAFEVPDSAKNLQLQFKCDLFGSGSAVIDLS